MTSSIIKGWTLHYWCTINIACHIYHSIDANVWHILWLKPKELQKCILGNYYSLHLQEIIYAYENCELIFFLSLKSDYCQFIESTTTDNGKCIVKCQAQQPWSYWTPNIVTVDVHIIHNLPHRHCILWYPATMHWWSLQYFQGYVVCIQSAIPQNTFKWCSACHTISYSVGLRDQAQGSDRMSGWKLSRALGHGRKSSRQKQYFLSHYLGQMIFLRNLLSKRGGRCHR